MFKKFTFSNQLSKEQEIKNVCAAITARCQSIEDERFVALDICNYRYDMSEAIEELGLDEPTLWQLIDTYIAQVLKSIDQFYGYLNNIKKANGFSEDDFKSLRELAHKNLGVARNLHIKDAEKLLNVLMHEEDIEYLFLCVEMLEAVTIRLRPNTAYNVLNLLKIQNYPPHSHY